MALLALSPGQSLFPPFLRGQRRAWFSSRGLPAFLLPSLSHVRPKPHQDVGGSSGSRARARTAGTCAARVSPRGPMARDERFHGRTGVLARGQPRLRRSPACSSRTCTALPARRDRRTRLERAAFALRVPGADPGAGHELRDALRAGRRERGCVESALGLELRREQRRRHLLRARRARDPGRRAAGTRPARRITGAPTARARAGPGGRMRPAPDQPPSASGSTRTSAPLCGASMARPGATTNPT